MKTALCYLAAMISVWLIPDVAKAAEAFEQCRQLGRGVNIYSYDPGWWSSEKARFKEKHFRLLSEAGFQSVRVNLQPFLFMEKAEPWTLSKSWFDTVDQAVELAGRYHLKVILDCHEFVEMGDHFEKNHDKFLAFWRQFSAHCRNMPDSVVFEILNEPSKQLTPVLWNQTLREALAIIRKENPNRMVIVGPAFWNSIDHLADLDLPADDRNLIVTVHYYRPMEFTHQGATWSQHGNKVGVEWAGTEAERQMVRNDFAKADAWAKQNHRPMFLGEFGTYDRAPIESRARYTDCIARTAESLGWTWAYWQFDGDFVLWDMKRDAWVEPILHALVPKIGQPKDR